MTVDKERAKNSKRLTGDERERSKSNLERYRKPSYASRNDTLLDLDRDAKAKKITIEDSSKIIESFSVVDDHDDGIATSRQDKKSKDSIEDEVSAINKHDHMVRGSYDKFRNSTTVNKGQKKKEIGGVNIKFKNTRSPSNYMNST